MTNETTPAESHSDIRDLPLGEGAYSSRYGALRVAALWQRVERLEAAVDQAIEAISGNRREPGTAFDILAMARQESLIGAILCSRETNDRTLDFWIPRIAEYEQNVRAAVAVENEKLADDLTTAPDGA